ncbi:probable G-protein coupled receptor 139 [Schistocerca gregaria]|uniref:probable G-protein coupled receptor 139 n=1 Tax=Schistocerca gregaria TaxID=7010 RepID=UPI00211E4BC8|nr:probable G-protein coupled receptor 139 [Schistocerca gregaria]
MLGEDVDEELGQWGAALGYMAGPAGRSGSSNGLLAALLDATLSSTTEDPSPVLDAAVNGTPAAPDNDTLCQLEPDCAAALAFRETSRFVVQRILVPILTVIGVTGNMATTVVLSRPRMRSSTNTYLCALAVSDLLYLCFILTLSFKHYPGMDQERHSRYWYYLPYGHWLTDATSSSSIWLTVSFTVERYIAVCHPLRGKVLCTEARARRVTLLVVVACLLATATTPYEWRITQTEDGLMDMVSSDFGKHPTYHSVFYWFSSVMFVLLPVVLLAIFNSFLVMAVHRSRRQRNRMTQVDQCDSNQRQENRITVTLIAVVVLFMVCQTPTAAMLLYTVFRGGQPGETENNVRLALGNIFNFMAAVHSACNFLLYCALSDKYRRTFVLTFVPQRCRRGRLAAQPSSRTAVSSTATNYTSVALHSSFSRGASMHEALNGHHPHAHGPLKWQPSVQSEATL